MKFKQELIDYIVKNNLDTYGVEYSELKKLTADQLMVCIFFNKI